jgi:hypothetical protein
LARNYGYLPGQGLRILTWLGTKETYLARNWTNLLGKGLGTPTWQGTRDTYLARDSPMQILLPIP